MNTMIQKAGKLRIGAPKAALIAECESAQDFAKYRKLQDQASKAIVFGAGGKKAALKEQFMNLLEEVAKFVRHAKGGNIDEIQKKAVEMKSLWQALDANSKLHFQFINKPERKPPVAAKK